jgi:hypothetical protein
MAPLAARAPPLTLQRVALAVGCGVECAPAPTWPEGAKGRQPAHGRATDPRAATQQSADAAPSHRQRIDRAALLHVRCPARARRAPRALEGGKS